MKSIEDKALNMTLLQQDFPYQFVPLYLYN